MEKKNYIIINMCIYLTVEVTCIEWNKHSYCINQEGHASVLDESVCVHIFVISTCSTLAHRHIIASVTAHERPCVRQFVCVCACTAMGFSSLLASLPAFGRNRN